MQVIILLCKLYRYINSKTFALCLAIPPKNNIVSEASYVYNLKGQKLIKNAKNGTLYQVFENLKLAVIQKLMKIPKLKNSNATFLVIFKHCESSDLLKNRVFKSGNTFSWIIPTDNRFEIRSMEATLEAFRYRRGVFLVLDQLLLPGKHEYVEVKTVEDGWSVINRMQVTCFSLN